MRADQNLNEKSIIEEHTINKNNIMKIQDAFKDFGDDTPEKDYFNVDENGDEIIEMVNKSHDNIENIQSKEHIKKSLSSEEIVNTYTPTEEDEIEDEGLIDKNYVYDDNQDETLLDGWDDDIPLAELNKHSRVQSLINFIGI
jgi:hypothetical protein